MVDSFAKMALETLRDLLTGEVKFLSGVSYQVEEVGRELQEMHCFLKDADKRQDNSDTIRNWVAELRDLACKAEVVLEKYAIEVTSKRGSRKNLKKLLKRFTCILDEGLSVHQIGKETEHIRSRMANLTKRLESITKDYPSSSLVVDADQRLLRQTFAHEVDEHFVGMKEDIDLLVSHSINDDRSHRVISICGMGGLGKTTLARKIYQHKDVKSRFKARAWVCITQQFQFKAILQGLLKQLFPEEKVEQTEKMNEDELVTQLYNLQKEKKCLVVLDDIWEINHWNILRRAFPIAEACCKILITTRNERIANTEFVHKLKCLSEEESWDLLQKIALPINYAQELSTVESELLEYNGKEMIRKCGCLPLAISVIGGILRQRQSSREWEKVNKNMDSYLKHEDGVQNDGRVENVLNLSYNVLPYYLKLCFLYLGCSSEDEDIEVEELYSLWIAEGMVSFEDKERGETLRDVAERYLSELASRCMVQVKMHELSTIRRFESCRLHDLIRDLCLSKGKEENFLETRDYQRGNSSLICRTRGLAIHFENLYDDDVEFECGGNKSLRSLLLLSEEWRNVSIKVSNLGMLKSLKILKLEGLQFKNGKLPSEMEKLILLKHLSIRESEVVKLPRFVCNLPCLQYLDLRIKGKIELPNVIHKLGRLRHLFCPKARSIVGGEKLKLNGLIELETMIGFDSRYDDAIATHFHKLTNLRRFDGEVCDIESLSMIVDHITNLKDQFYETELTVSGCDFNSETGSALLRKILLLRSLSSLNIYCSVGKLPAYEPQFCRNLVQLELWFCEIEEDPMEILENFPVLRKLQLQVNSFVGREMICGANGFPQLKFLLIYHLKNLEKWRVDEKAMPNLSSLTIRFCTKLEMIPDGLRFITTLQELNIILMPKEFNDKLRVVDGQTGKDYDKIKHIPNITLEDW